MEEHKCPCLLLPPLVSLLFCSLHPFALFCANMVAHASKAALKDHWSKPTWLEIALLFILQK